MRGYYDFAHDTRPPPSGARGAEVPAGFAVFADSYRADALRGHGESSRRAPSRSPTRRCRAAGSSPLCDMPELLANKLRESSRRLR